MVRTLSLVGLAATMLAACSSTETTGPTPGTTTTTHHTGGTGGTGGAGASGGGGGTAGTGGVPDCSSPPFDLAGGSWTLEDASNTPGTISHDGALAITPSGVLAVAFSEPDSVNSSDQDIYTTRKTGSAFAAATALTSDNAVQNAYPSIVADGETLHLVWGGYPGGDNDVFYSSYTGSWSARVDLTSPSEGNPAREDFAPDLAIGPNGELAVAYLSSPDTQSPPEVRVLGIANGAPSGSPETVIPAGTDGCENAHVAFDGAGHLHVVADCGPLFAASVYYATNASGSWTSSVLAGSANADDASPDIAVGPDGTTVHVVWQGNQSCGPATCSDIRYARSTGAAFSAPVDVTTSPSEPEGQPHIAIDACGRPVVTYPRANATDYFDIFVTLSNDEGASFVAESNVTPGTDSSDEWMAYSIVMHPVTRMPHLTFVRIMSGTNPLDTEVMHAQFVPTP
jgi:hypothetical protein